MFSLSGVHRSLNGLYDDLNHGIMATVILVHDKGQEMQIPILVGAASKLENFRLEHTVGIIANAGMQQVEPFQGLARSVDVTPEAA